ncbi:hypothetical protein AFERRID_08930 [Acidithiobacillus ferridurans]|uniref:Lipoprotein n=1 Tax=Acidithiobacillus ferridurans TaxID=1232575 RepID=A0A2Z6IKW4_ACIFI|nr:hypothetical protein AFERRID_08930 [Acidithiobacillus ferridurans]
MNKLRQVRRLVYMALFVFVSASMLSGCIIAPPYGGYYGGYGGYYGGRGEGGWHHGEDH